MNDAMLQTILLVAIIIVAIALTGIVLLQKSEGGALGMGGGPSGFMTARGAGNEDPEDVQSSETPTTETSPTPRGPEVAGPGSKKKPAPPSAAMNGKKVPVIAHTRTIR